MIDEELLADLVGALSDLQGELLQYERAKQDGRREVLRDLLLLLMRRAHSVKGGLALAERPESATLLHHLESLLSQSGQAEGEIPREVIDLFFDCLDAMGASLGAGGEDLPRLRLLIGRAEAMLQGAGPAKHLRSFPFPVSAAEYERFKRAEGQGLRAYCIEKVVRTDLSESAFSRLPILDDLRANGELVAVRPSYADFDRAREEVVITLAGVTGLSAAEFDLTVFDTWEFCAWPACPTASPQASPRPASSPQPSPRPAASPHPQANPKVPAKPTEVAQQPLRLLIAEDDPTSRILACELLKPYGECHVACNGREAIALAQLALDDGRPYDAICLDIMMPEVDGLEVLRTLRSLEAARGTALKQRAKVVMMTALSSYDYFHQAFVDESDSYLVKPITKAAIERQFSRLGFARST